MSFAQSLTEGQIGESLKKETSQIGSREKLANEFTKVM
jgi:hypothetical protein